MKKSFNAHENRAAAPKSIRQLARGSLGKLALFTRRDEGAIAVEFAFIVPILAIAVLYMTVSVVGYYQRMDIEQIIRAGAEFAKSDPGDAAVTVRMQQIATEKGYTLSEAPVDGQPSEYDKLLLHSVRVCTCPSNPLLNIGCNTMCASGRPVMVSYKIFASYHWGAEVGLVQALTDLTKLGHHTHFISGLEKRVVIR